MASTLTRRAMRPCGAQLSSATFRNILTMDHVDDLTPVPWKP